MRLGKTLLVGVGLYAMRVLLNRARAKHHVPAVPHAAFADTEPATHALHQDDETARAGSATKNASVLKS